MVSYRLVPSGVPSPPFVEPDDNPMLHVAELFAGVGGFRLGLRAGGWRVVWSNQWEPSTRAQHASDCYVRQFGPEGHACRDIARALDDLEEGSLDIPKHSLVVGGFPCQDYSVAKTLNQAHGIQGKKGVLWWEIFRYLDLIRPRMALLENVDRLLKSPAKQRGRDFAIMLASMASLGYKVEWRVVNAADYGFPQRRRRVFIVASLPDESSGLSCTPAEWVHERGVLARALPVEPDAGCRDGICLPHLVLDRDVLAVSDGFGLGLRHSPFLAAGVMVDSQVWTYASVPKVSRAIQTLGDILVDEEQVPESYFVRPEQLDAWRYLKGAKSERRTHKGSGAVYHYTEGALPFPDPVDRAARTILTGEGGTAPSRFKHIVMTPSGRYRRLTPIELERLNGFPDDWTAGMPDGRRAFCMGNALVVGLVERIGRVLAEDHLARMASPLGRVAAAGL